MKIKDLKIQEKFLKSKCHSVEPFDNIHGVSCWLCGELAETTVANSDRMARCCWNDYCLIETIVHEWLLCDCSHD